MNNLDKYEAMQQWLDANPGKSPEDWLLETRCVDDKQREQVVRILRLCDENHLVYEIPYGTPSLENEPVWFDFAIHGAPIDLDAPDHLFEGIDPKRPWEKAWDYIRWKAAKDLGPEHKQAYDFLYNDVDYFHNFFRDWRDHSFLEGFASEKTFDWSK